MGALVLEEPEVVERVAVDDEEIRVRIGRDHTELAFLTQDARGNGRRGLDDFERLHDLAPNQELSALLGLELTEQVAPVRDGHTHALADLERAIAVLEDPVV